MSAEREKVEAIFDAAIRLRSPAERTAYLSQACGGDSALRAEVEELIEAHDQAGDFLEIPAIEKELPSEGDPRAEGPGTLIGRYKLLEKIGEGGFGVVYMAEQTEPVRRRVALKIIKLGMDTKQVIARFEAGRQALAMMDHPNIAKVLDGGATDSGRPYFVMELVRGIPITEYCDKSKLPTRERLGLFIDVCHALQHAHQKGIIHRDVKPTNVLVTLHDGKPVPKVIDFGIAKALGRPLTDKTLFTEYRQFVGTPEYMSPEQAQLGGLDIDTRCDIYALGVLLYELLTGTTPFEPTQLRSTGYDEILRTIRETDPPKPSTRLKTLGDALTEVATHRQVEPGALGRLVRGDLDWIAMKALEKDRARRYETANGLAEDIGRHLGDEPVLAGPPSLGYRMSKFVRRNRTGVLVGSVVAAALLAGLVAATFGFVQARRERDRAGAAASRERDAASGERDAASRERDAALLAKQQQAEAQRRGQEAAAAKNRAERHLYAAHMRVAHHSWQQGHVEHARDLLEGHVPGPGRQDPRSFEWYYLWRLSHSGRFTLRHPCWVHSLAFAKDGDTLATAGRHGRVRLWHTATGEMQKMLRADRNSVRCVAFSPDGKILATGGSDHTLKLWARPDWNELLDLGRQADSVQSITFSPDGKTLAAAIGPRWRMNGTSEVKLWDVAAGQERTTLEKGAQQVFCLTFSPDGKTLASAGSREVTLWDLATGRARLKLEGGANAVGISPDGKTLATYRDDLRFIDLETGKERSSAPAGGGYALAFSPDGKWLATGGQDSSVRLWEVATGQQRAVFKGHTSWIWAVAFSPDGRFLASGSRDNTAKLWDVAKELRGDVLQGQSPVAFSPDGKGLATGGPDGAIKLWDVATGNQRALLEGHAGPVDSVAFSPDGRTLVAAAGSRKQPGEVKLWDVATRQARLTLEAPTGEACSVAFSGDGKTLAAGAGRDVKLWDTATGELRATLSGHITELSSVAFSPSGTALAAGTRELPYLKSRDWCNESGEVKLWDLTTQKVLRTLKGGLAVRCVAFAPDGKALAAGFWDAFEGLSGGVARVWDVTTGEELAALKGHKDGVSSLAFCPDERTLATASEDGTVRLWDTGTWQERLTLTWDGHKITGVAFSPDGRILATGSPDGAVKLWRAATDDEVAKDAEEAAAWEWAPLWHQGMDHHGTGAFDKAVADLSKAIELRPDKSRLWRWRGLAYSELGQWEKALADFDEAIQLDPQDGPNWSHRGWARCNLGQWEKALADCAKGIELDPRGGQCWHLRGRAYAKRGQWEEVLADSAKAIELDLGKSDYWSLRGCAYHKLGQGEEAIADYTKAIELNPRLAVYWGNRAVSYRDLLGHFEKAIADYTKAIELNPRLAVYWHNRAVTYRKLGQFEKAIADYSKAIELSPGKSLYWNERGFAYHSLGQFEKAIADYTKAIELDPRSVTSLSNRSVTYAELGQFEKALADCSKAIELDPRDPLSWNTRGVVYGENLGQWEKALADFSRAIELDPNNGIHWRVRGNSYAGLGRWDEAAGDWRKASELSPENAYLRYLIALAQLGGGDADGYRKTCAHLLERFGETKDAEAAHLAAWTCILAPSAVADAAAPVRLAETAVRSDPKSDNFLKTLGAALYRAGRFNEAVQRLSEAHGLWAAETKPASSPAYTWFFLTMAHHRAGHPAEAREYLAKAVKRAEEETRPDAAALAVWQRRLTLKLLRREAEALLGATTRPASRPAPKEVTPEKKE